MKIKDVFLYPNGRIDVVNLKDWLKVMMEKVDESGMSMQKELFDYY